VGGNEKRGEGQRGGHTVSSYPSLNRNRLTDSILDGVGINISYYGTFHFTLSCLVFFYD
jgi:hypothetical protein